MLDSVLQILSGDAASWRAEWTAKAKRVSKEAEGQLAHGHRISTRDGFLPAATYYRTSALFLHSNPEDPRISNAYEKSGAANKANSASFDPPIQPGEISYKNTTLPGDFLQGRRFRPQAPLIIHFGFDGSIEKVHIDGARAAVERGYNVLAFDGPRQFGLRHREHLIFRPDLENVVAPAVDFALTLSGRSVARKSGASRKLAPAKLGPRASPSCSMWARPMPGLKPKLS